MSGAGPLDALIFGVRYLFAQSDALAQRARLSFGQGFTVTDDDTNKWTRVELAAAIGASSATVTGTASAAPINLDHTLPDNTVFSIRVRVAGSKRGGGARAHELHELLVYSHGGTLTIAEDDLVAPVEPGTYAFTISATGLTLRVACDPGGDTVDFAAQLDWLPIGGA